MRIQWLLATRYLRGRLQRSALTTLAISFGVAILFGMNGLIPPMLDAFRHSMYTSAGQVDLTISSAANGTFDQSVLNQVVSTDGVSQATGYLVRTVSLPSSLGGSSNTLNSVPSVNLTGVNPTDAENIHVYSMVTGRFLTSTDTDAIVVSEALATNLKLKVGDAWELPSASGTASFTIVGIMNITSPTAVNQVIIPLVTAQKVLGADGQINSIDILLKSGTNRDTVQSALAQKLGDGFKFGSVETGSEFDTTLSLGSAIMWFFGIAALIMAGFIIFNTFRTLVAERRRDLAMLRAIGAKRSSLVGMILMESLLQGLIGTAIGLIIGWLLTIGLLRLMSGFLDNFAHINIGSPIFSSPTFIASILLGVGLSVASAYFPARSTLSITPLEALRPAIGAAENRRMKNRAWIGLAFILVASASLFFKNIGITTLALVIFLVGLVMIAPALVRPVAVIAVVQQGGAGHAVEDNSEGGDTGLGELAEAFLDEGAAHGLEPAHIDKFGTEAGKQQGVGENDRRRRVDDDEIVDFREVVEEIARGDLVDQLGWVFDRIACRKEIEGGADIGDTEFLWIDRDVGCVTVFTEPRQQADTAGHGADQPLGGRQRIRGHAQGCAQHHRSQRDGGTVNPARTAGYSFLSRQCLHQA